MSLRSGPLLPPSGPVQSSHRPQQRNLGIRFSTIGDFEAKVFERSYVIAIICFFDTCNQKTILQLRDGKLFIKTL